MPVELLIFARPFVIDKEGIKQFGPLIREQKARDNLILHDLGIGKHNITPLSVEQKFRVDLIVIDDDNAELQISKSKSQQPKVYELKQGNPTAIAEQQKELGEDFFRLHGFVTQK